MKAVFKIISLISILWIISVESAEDYGRNKIDVSFLKSTDEKVQINVTKANYGDLVLGEKQDKDILLYREVFINDINGTSDQYLVMKTETNKYKFTNIRFLNIGRQIAYQYDYKLVDNSKLEIDFIVKKNEQPRVWVELYGKSAASITSSGLVLIFLNIIYALMN